MTGSIGALWARILSGSRRFLLPIAAAAIVILLSILFHFYLGLAALFVIGFGALQPTVLGESAPRIAKEDEPEAIHGGALAWDPPQAMRVGRTERISVRIGDAQVALAALVAGLRERDLIVAQDISVSARMRVRLMGSAEDFRIAVLSSEDQLMQGGEAARWDFAVTPRRSGRRTLRLLASVRTVMDGQEEVRDLPAYEKEVTIAVAPLRSVGRFLEANWKWLVTILIPIFGWLLLNSGLAGKLANALKGALG